MSKVKAGGSSKNVHNNAGARLGVKRFGGQQVNAGEVLVRQTGATKIAGPGTYMSRNYTIHAAHSGVAASRRSRSLPSLARPSHAPRCVSGQRKCFIAHIQNHLTTEVVFLFSIISPARLVRITNKYLCLYYSAITRFVLKDSRTSPLLLCASEYPLHQ